MKKDDLLKYFLNQCNLFTVKEGYECGLTNLGQIEEAFDCTYTDIFESRCIVPGDYIVTYSPKGLKPYFIVVKDEVIRYFTLIEEE